MQTSSQTSSEKRLEIQQLLPCHTTDNGQDVIRGLTQTQKSLPPRYFYDDKGSQLFEAICELPEYYPTRTEAAILREYAIDIAHKTGPCELVELGSGSSTKTRLLLEAYQDLGESLHYIPIDVSAGILQESAKQLLADYPSLSIHGIVGTYSQALASLSPRSLPGRMAIFLGSTLGNFNETECDRLFSQITTALQPGEYFLLGIDLQKPIEVLEAAYNDSQGVTAAFNLNMLESLNWRFQGNFNPTLFEHWAFYNVEQSQIEMHLRCLQSHSVRLESLDLNVEFSSGETILTEISRKFNIQQMQAYLQTQGLTCFSVWTDPKQWFGLLLCQR
ncbi:MAG: L-histidine N(alpha)-methyltransferase [Chroococcales cyanobacterium]